MEEKLININGHISLLEKCYNEFKLEYTKQFVKEVLIQRAVNDSSNTL